MESSLTANQRYKKSGSSLPFTEWIEREKNKNVFIPNKLAQQEFLNADGPVPEDTKSDITTDSPKSTNNVLNLDPIMMRNVGIVVVIILGVVVVYKLTKKQAVA